MWRLTLVAVLVAGSAWARNGGIEAQSCSGCHGVGTQQTSITLTPSTFGPGDTITVRVTMSGSGSRGGFFLTSNGVGTFATVSGQGTRLSNGNVVHATPKSAASGAVTFEARWTAPSNPGGVVFDTATVLADGNGQRTGDQSAEAQRSEAFGCAGTTYYRDNDGDGVGSAASGTVKHCTTPPQYSAVDGDCDDFDNRRTPGKSESCNNLDDDCDGQVDEGLGTVTTWPDADGDGYGDTLGAPSSGCGGGGRAQNDDDCNDADNKVHPGASETCNQKDDDCDGQVDEGARVRCGTGWCEALGPTCRAEDCTPGQPLSERCNALDDDCDGQIDEGDLCGAGASCVDGSCLEGPPPVDAGVTSDAGSVGGGSGGGGGGEPVPSETCASAPFLLPLLALLVARRRSHSPISPSGRGSG